jgi:homoserine O-acetyltransferase
MPADIPVATRELTVSIGELQLDCGAMLRDVEQRVTVYGRVDADQSNVVIVAHALTGSSRVAQWWPAIAGTGGLFDPQRYCVIGVNALGSCYGSTGPSNAGAFPRISVADIVRAARRALDQIEIERIACVIGGSLGGMQALQWALDDARVRHAIVVGAHDHHSAMGVALNAVQREALALDPVRGLRLARKIATITYKSEELFNRRHGRRNDRSGEARFDVEGYLQLQADAFASRMDARTYATLTHAMDSFDVRDAYAPAARPTPAKLTFVGISSDWLFRACDAIAASERFRARGHEARYLELQSAHGHDAFLADAPQLAALLRSVLVEPAADGGGDEFVLDGVKALHDRRFGFSGPQR